MRRAILHKLILFLFALPALSLPGQARSLYWVGGSGTWNNRANWSIVSGGQGGAGIPALNDDVFFDGNSFHNPGETVLITGAAVCRNMDWQPEVYSPVLAGSSSSSLTVYGSLTLTQSLSWQFSGTLYFKSAVTGNVISTYGRTFDCNVCFDGSGSWTLANGFLTLSSGSALTLASGTLTANGNIIRCGTLNIQGPSNKELNINNSALFISNRIDSTTSSNFRFSAIKGSIYYKNSSTTGNFSNFNRQLSSHRVSNPQSEDTSVILPSCNCNDTSKTHGVASCCNGKIIISDVVEGNPFCTGHPFKYQWFPAILNNGPAIYDTVATNICENLNGGNISCTIFDTCDDAQATLTWYVGINPISINNESTKPPTCNGDCNGWIIINSGITGGTPSYTYDWSAGKPPGNQIVPAGKKFIDSGLCVTGLNSYYYIIITDAHKCRDSLGYFIGQPKAITVTYTVTSEVSCFGQSNGSVTASASGGHNAPYTYNWSNGKTTSTITGLSAGNYTVTVKDDSLCTGSAVVTITQPPLLTLTQSQTNVTCNGLNNGSACVTANGGTPPYNYSWAPGLTNTTPCVNGLAPSPPIYTVTVTDANGCTVTAQFTITQPATLNDNFSIINNDSCFNVCDGSAKMTPTGGTPPYTYSWAPGLTQTTATISGLCASPPTYTATVTDAHGCVSSTQFTITQPAQINITIAPVVEVLCNGQCTGSATATVSGGTPAYKYAWSNGKTTSSITALCAGNYSLTVTDKNGCTGTAAVTITQPSALNIQFSSVNVACHGSCTGSATASVTGGTPAYNYLWNNGKTTSGITALCAGTYTVTVTDANGCTATADITITQPPIALSVSLSAVPNPLACNGNSNATISSAVNGGTAPYAYSWQPGGQVTPNITGQSAGTYTLVVTDAHGCQDSAYITISQPALLTANISSVTDIKCNGNNSGSATVTASGGTLPYGYSWSPSGGTSATATGLSAGTYTVTVTDKNGCTATAQATITQPSAININIGRVDVTCNGLCNGSASATVSGGTPGYNYLWSNGKTTSSVSALCPGSYTLTVHDNNGCTATAAVTITQPSPLSVFISATTSSCNICNGSATASVTGGTAPYNYNWTPVGQTNATATGLCVGTYTIDVTDANGCTASATATIVPTVKISVTTNGNNVNCYNECDGIASANPSGGALPYTYTWAPGGQSTQTITGLCPGGYTVTVKDANGCTTIDSARIGNPPQLKPSTTQNNVTCVGKCNGSATATATGGTGGYSYSWAPGGQTTSTITGLCVGSYTVTVTDAKGCDSSVVVNITSGGNISANPTINNEPSCGSSNGSITLNPTGGSPPYLYAWAPGGQSTQTVTGLSAGTYTVTITDNSGCAATFLIVLNNVAGPTLIVSSQAVTCADTCDGSATVSVTAGAGPFSYAWSNGKTTTTITALCAGVYACSVTDKNGCISNITDTVKAPVPINPNPTIQDITCNNGNPTGKISLAPTGGTGPYHYLWAPGGQTNSSISGLSAGTYSVTIHDNVSCDTAFSYTITEPPAITLTLKSTNITCNGANNGSATVSATGGTPGYIYNWQPGGAITPTVVNLSPGTYTVTVTDANGCNATASVTITQPSPLNVTIKPINVTCDLLSDGGAATTVTGGTPQYTYHWSNGQTNDSLKNVSSGKYYLTVTDSNGCTYFDSVTITQPGAINVTFTTTNVSCNGSCNGTATANITGGTSPYAYSWSTAPVQTNQTATGLCSGAYTVTVTDANGCTGGNSVTITEPAALSGNVTVTGTTCDHTCDGSATAAPSGGTGAYTYKWLPGGQISSSINNLCGGKDTLILRDANGCTDTDIVTIPVPAPLSPGASTSPSNCNVSDGAISLAPTGGTGPYNYVWTPPVSTSNNATGLSAGIYTVQVTDSKGCDSTFSILLNSTGGVSSFKNVTFNEPCFGETVGYIDVTPSGGTPPYVYFWNNLPVPAGQGTDSIYNLAAGSYTLQVTDAGGCVQFDTVSVTQPAALANNAVVTGANCSGVCNGSISVTSSGGTSPYTYSWSNSATTASITGLCPGNYTDTLTDANGCKLIETFAIKANVTITVSASQTNVLCNGAATGSASATASGGGGTYNYSWSPGLQTSQSVTGLAAGSYTVTITDQNGCQGIDTLYITQPPAISINLKVTEDSCNGSCDGRIIAAVSGGTPAYIYSWSPPGGTSDSIKGLCAGTYSLNVTDNNGCVATDNVTLINPPVFTESHTLTEPTCNSTDDGIININPSGGIAPYTYTWSPNGLTSASASNLSIGTYTIYVTDSTGCTIPDIVTLISDTTVIAAAGNDTDICTGASFLTLNGSKSTPTGSISYRWLDSNTASVVGNTAIITIPAPSSTTTYELITKEGNCSDTSRVTVTVNPGPPVSAGPDQFIFIYNSAQIGGNPTGPAGSTYRWRPPSGLNDSTISNPTASPVVTTTYTVYVTNALGCTSSDTVTVFILPQIIIYDGFTPNGDGMNDVWDIGNINEFPNAVVEIYNRWGELLYRTQGYYKPWNGMYDNAPVPVGTYYYIINLNDSRFPKAYTGPLTIQR